MGDETYEEATISANSFVSEHDSSCNPNLISNLDPAEQEKIKGDAIGETLYSERFVLQTMIDLAEIIKEDSKVVWSEEMENDLCTLWDMTTEKDVVFFLLEHEFVELSLSVISKSIEIRLTEIMVGIVGNMCCFHESCDKVFECDYEVYLSLIKITDTPLLVQLMRLLKSLLYKDAKHFNLIITDEVLAQTKFFLSSSQNSELLLYTLQTFELIVDKKKSDIINEETLLSTNEAFKQLFKNLSDSSEFLNQEHEKIITAYLKVIQDISLSVEEVDDKDNICELKSCLEQSSTLTLTNFETILSLFCNVEPFLSTPENMEFYLYCIVQFIKLLESSVSVKILKSFLVIFDIIVSEKIKFDEDILNDMVDIICKTIKSSEVSALLKVINFWSRDKILRILKDTIVKRKTINCDKTYLDKINKIISS